MAQVLLVEDDVVTAAIMARAIERAGHQIEVAKNGLQAVELLEGGAFTVLVTDLMMPRLGGEELCELVRSNERTRTLPILLTTGVTDRDRLAHLEAIAGVEVVAKPIRLAELIERIDQLAIAAGHSGGLACGDDGVDAP